MELNVELKCSDTKNTQHFKMRVEDWDNKCVKELKEILESETQVPACDQELYYQGRLLRNDKFFPLKKLYLREGDTILVECIAQGDLADIKGLIKEIKEFSNTITCEDQSELLTVTSSKKDDSSSYMSYDYIARSLDQLSFDYFIPWKNAKSLVHRHYFVQEGGFDAFMEVLKFATRRYKIGKKPGSNTLGRFNRANLKESVVYTSQKGDPLFLALLQKRLSGYKDQSVRPGFSPKRYIANLGNSLEEDTRKRLAAAGSLKDPALLTYDPKGDPLHRGDAVGSLFPDKPQPYSTMSLPPFSPSNSMFESSFHFYKNGMSTGAASMFSLNSESEYAPSSRALSPEEPLSDRLSEVELLPQRKDPYNQLNAKQKEDLLSQILVQKTLDSISPDLSDLQGWVTNYPDNDGGVHLDPSPVVTLPQIKPKHRGSLKSGSLTSIPRLPPIQSAGARPSTPEELEEESKRNKSSEVTVHQQREIKSSTERTDDILDPGLIQVDLSSLDQSSFLLDNQREPQGGEDVILENSEKTATESSVDRTEHENQGESASQSIMVEESREGTEHLHDIQGDAIVDNEMTSGSEEMLTEQSTVKRDEVVGLDDIMLSEEPGLQEDEQHRNQVDEMKRIEERTDKEEERTAQDYSESQKQPKEAGLDSTELQVDDEDEGVGLDGNELDDINRGEELQDELYPATDIADRTAIREEDAHSAQEVISSQQAEPPPPISLEDLQGEARNVASRVLSRPQSGMVFMEDVKSAIAMWADRLTNLLGPPKQDARVSSASHQRPQLTGLPAQGVSNRHTRQRKVSRSAGPSPAALRKALKISGGEIPEIETLRNLPPLPERLYKSNPAHPGSGDASVHKYNKKHGSGSTKESESSTAGPHSIPWERVSNADVQVDIFSYATRDSEPSFQRVQADELNDEESEQEDEEFKTALNAIVTEVKQDYSLIEAKSRMEPPSPKKEQKPFQFPRPAASKPPAGLQNKPPPGQVKKKAQAGPTKKPVVGKKKVGKKPAKQQPKPSNKTAKPRKGKAEASNKGNELEKTEDVSNAITMEVEKPEPFRVDSETGEREAEASDRTVVSSTLSRVTSSRVSSKASDEVTVRKNDSPTESNTTLATADMPVLVPKPPEPQPVHKEPETEQSPAPVEQKPVQESRAAKRAAERAAAAERRRQEVERKRREREEAKKRAMEEEARLELVRLEAEEEMKRREEERRQRREEKEEAKRRERDEELEKERLANMKAERERRAKEDWKKRQQQVLAHRKLEEELRKEQEKIEAELEAARLREEEERIKAMEESERIAFLEKMRQEEDELRRRLEEQKRKEDEERRVREEEKRQREEALALLRQKQLQRHLFIAGILKESQYLALCQRLTRAFTFSYFDLLPWNHLQHMNPPPSPVRDLLLSVKEKIPPTIVEEDEDAEEQ